MNQNPNNNQIWFDNLGDNPNDDQIIDAVLKLLFQSQSRCSPFLNLPHYMTDERIDKIVGLMHFQNLAKKDGITFGNFNIPLKIEPNGNQIFQRHGGWLKYLENQKSEEEDSKKKESESHIANLASSKAAVDSAKSARVSKIWSIIGVIVAFFALFLSYLQFSDSKENEDSLSKINNYLIKQDSIINGQNHKLQKNDSIINSRQNKLIPKIEIQP